MGTKIVKWMADDGTEFHCEDDMIAYEWDRKMQREIAVWLLCTPDLSEAAMSRRANTVIAFLRWKQDWEQGSGGGDGEAPSEADQEAEEGPGADQDLAAAA